MLKIIKIILKKIYIEVYFSRYVKNDEIIQQDIIENIRVRGCNVRDNNIKTKFNHLMMYYPDFAFIFFWRIGAMGKWSSKYFTPNFDHKIFRSTKIDGGLNCFHPFGTVINAKTIGKNFQFRNGLTIGNKNNDNLKLPQIGDNVTVGVNAVIIGDIKIGNNVAIGAGSIVVKDIPDNAIVAGNPAKIIRLKNA